MIDISVQNIKKAFEEGNDILDGITFDVNEGERVGLLGKNGAGKTTLLKIITGELYEDDGVVIIPEFKKTGLISQIPVYPASYTGEDVLRTAFTRLFSIKAEMERLEELMSTIGTQSGQDDGSPHDSTGSVEMSKSVQAVLDEYDKLAHEYERSGGYTIETELSRVVNGLQIPHSQRAQRFDTLSGGEKTRINLARLILENTDILLLDEPTNHLDMNATIWLEGFLQKFKGTALIISHDRYFLDRTINRVVEINAGKADFYGGNYSFYVQEKQRRYDEQLEKYQREQAESKRLHASADRLQLWGTGNSQLMKKSFAVRTRAERAVKTDRPDKDKKMRAKFTEREFRGDEVVVIKGLTKTYDGKKLFDIEELLVQAKERIAIIGDNGTGKTTLVKMIMGEQEPDTGFARRGPSVKPAYLPQIIHFENPRRTIMDTLIYEQNDSPQTARNRLGAYLFSGEDVFKQVGDLSGGEKSRLRLCMLMSGEINLLILDEPTNHLDLDSREWIEKALAQYDETLIFISHDRYFINRFATRIWELDGGIFTDFEGTYEQYVAEKAEQGNVKKSGDGRAISKNKGRPPAYSKQTKESSARQEPAKKPGKKPAEVQKELRRLEREIEKLEIEIYDIELQREEFSSDFEKLLELDDHEREVKSLLDSLLEDWEVIAAQAPEA